MWRLLRYAFLVLALPSGNVCAETTLAHWPLKQIFGKDAAILSLGSQSVAEVCPDDSCFRFVIKGDKALDVVHDFAYLYLWLVESFDLANRQDTNAQRFVMAILNKRKGNCSGQDEDAIARCTLARLAVAYKIIGLEKKFENGWNQTRPLDISMRFKQTGVVQ